MTIQTIIQLLAEGMVTSLQIFMWTLVGSMPLGLLIAYGRMSKFKPLSWLVQAYISVMRGTPLMLQLFAVYFGPYYIFGIPISPGYRFTATLIAFIVNYAAYFAEIYRSGIESIPTGQYEAANALGFSRLQTFKTVVLPQMFKRILPSITNEVITLVKDTSLAFAIGVTEMFTTAKAIAAAQRSMTAFAVAGLFYYLFNAVVAFAMNRVEKHFSYYSE